jgi:hypothetical protein
MLVAWFEEPEPAQPEGEPAEKESLNSKREK